MAINKICLTNIHWCKKLREIKAFPQQTIHIYIVSFKIFDINISKSCFVKLFVNNSKYKTYILKNIEVKIMRNILGKL